MQSLNFVGSQNAMSMLPVKARYGYKKDYISVVKNGYIFLEFMEVE